MSAVQIITLSRRKITFYVTVWVQIQHCCTRKKNKSYHDINQQFCKHAHKIISTTLAIYTLQLYNEENKLPLLLHSTVSIKVHVLTCTKESCLIVIPKQITNYEQINGRVHVKRLQICVILSPLDCLLFLLPSIVCFCTALPCGCDTVLTHSTEIHSSVVIIHIIYCERAALRNLRTENLFRLNFLKSWVPQVGVYTMSSALSP